MYKCMYTAISLTLVGLIYEYAMRVCHRWPCSSRSYSIRCVTQCSALHMCSWQGCWVRLIRPIHGYASTLKDYLSKVRPQVHRSQGDRFEEKKTK